MTSLQIISDENDSDGTSSTANSRYSLPIEVQRLIILRLKALGWDKTLSRVAHTSKSLYDIATPILYGSITLTSTNTKKFPPLFWCDRHEDDYLDEDDQVTAEIWLIDAAIKGHITRWESPKSIMNKMLHSDRRADRDFAHWFVTEDKKNSRWHQDSGTGEVGNYELEELSVRATGTLQSLIAKTMRIANWRHIERLFVIDYPRYPDDLRDYEDFYRKTGSSLCMPKLRARCFVEDLSALMETFTAPLPSNRVNIIPELDKASEVEDELDNRRGVLGRFFGGVSVNGIAVCWHGAGNGDKDIGSRIAPFLENITGISSVTLHGRQDQANCVISHCELADPYIRVIIADLDAPHLSHVRTIGEHEVIALWYRLDYIAEELCADTIYRHDRNSPPLLATGSHIEGVRSLEGRFRFVIDFRMFSGTSCPTMTEVKATWTEIMDHRLPDVGIPEYRERARALVSFTDVSATDAEEWDHLCRPCDACGGLYIVNRGRVRRKRKVQMETT